MTGHAAVAGTRYLALLALVCLPAQSQAASWPVLPAKNGSVMLPAQESPHRPGPRRIKVYVYYPGQSINGVNAKTGLMLSLHNWGGTHARGTADPAFLVERYNVVAICVDYLQSGKRGKTEPYDFGYLQALDALRALWFVFDGLDRQDKPFARGRIFSAGGSGGGNVSLMVNKLAPRTFACIIDCSGMAKLSDDIAFNLPGGSRLDACWKREPDSAHHLTKDAQALRFVGNPQHLVKMKSLGNACKIVVSHGSQDLVCPIEDAREMVRNMKAAGLDVEAHFITKADFEGKIITNTGHSVGNRTLIVDKFAGRYLSRAGPSALSRSGKCDFELRDETVRYATPNGAYVISYKVGYPVGRFEKE